MALSLNTFVERYAEINNMPKTKSKAKRIVKQVVCKQVDHFYYVEI